MESLRGFESITVVEPHPDDFCLNMLGTMVALAEMGTLKRLRIVTVFSDGAGISMVPTSVLGPFFPDLDHFRAISMKMQMIMKGGSSDVRKQQSIHVRDLMTEFSLVNKITPADLLGRIKEASDGLIICPMGFKHPDHNLLSRLGLTDVHYREYPYYWNRSESFDRRLYEYNVYKLYDRFEMSSEAAALKWKIFATVYGDVMGTFNPRFMRPYFRNVRSEEIYKSDVDMFTNDVKACVINDRDYVEERSSTHRWV